MRAAARQAAREAAAPATTGPTRLERIAEARLTSGTINPAQVPLSWVRSAIAILALPRGERPAALAKISSQAGRKYRLVQQYASRVPEWARMLDEERTTRKATVLFGLCGRSESCNKKHIF